MELAPGAETMPDAALLALLGCYLLHLCARDAESAAWMAVLSTSRSGAS